PSDPEPTNPPGDFYRPESRSNMYSERDSTSTEPIWQSSNRHSPRCRLALSDRCQAMLEPLSSAAKNLMFYRLMGSKVHVEMAESGVRDSWLCAGCVTRAI